MLPAFTLGWFSIHRLGATMGLLLRGNVSYTVVLARKTGEAEAPFHLLLLLLPPSACSQYKGQEELSAPDVCIVMCVISTYRT